MDASANGSSMMDHHGLLIAQLISVHKVPFHVICSPEFRELQDLYVASADRTLKSGLVFYPRKIRHEMLPLRYIQAVARSRARIHASTLSNQLTLADDGWASRPKVRYAAVTIGVPLVPSEMIALSRIQSTELHGVAVYKAWEQLILLGDRAAPLAEYPAAFALPLPGSPVRFCV
jgi:hypothetical protein